MIFTLSGFRRSAAIFCTFFGHVAVNSIVRRSAGMHSAICRMSFSNPMSSILSASSKISTFALASDVTGFPPLLCMSSMSNIRPGVAMMSSHPRWSCDACAHFGAPP